MQKNKQQTTRNFRRRGLALLLSVFLIAGLVLSAGTVALAEELPHWELSVAITGGGSDVWLPGSELKLTFTLDLVNGEDLSENELAELLGNDIELYINKDILPTGLVGWGNPELGDGASGVLAFVSGSTVNSEIVTSPGAGVPGGLDAGDYYQYTLKFNTSPAAMELWPSQFYIESSATALVTTQTILGGSRLIYATDGNSGSIAIGDTGNPPVKPNDPPADTNRYDSAPEITKTMVSKMRSIDNGAYYQFAGSGNVPLSAGDLVVFTITVTGGANGSTLNQITDTLGAGYVLLANDVIVSIPGWSGSRTVEYYLSNRYNNGAAAWVDSTGTYTLTFGPARKIKPGATLTFGMFVKVDSGFSATTLTNSATATYNDSSTTAAASDLAAKDHAQDAPLPDVALAVSIRSSYDKAGGAVKNIDSPYSGGVTVEAGGYVRVVHRLYNDYTANVSGNVPIDSVTVRIYVPKAGYEWVTESVGLVSANSLSWVDKSSELIGSPPGMWASDDSTSAYYVYEQKFIGWIACSSSSDQLTAYLQVKGDQGDIAAKPGDYYIASEIVGYSYRYGGSSVDCTYDVDSVQDTDPLNDLKGTVIMSKSKEKDNLVSESGYTRITDMTTASNEQSITADEDDFDFTWVGAITSYEAPVPPTGDALTKEQLLGADDTEGNGSAAQATKAATVFNAVLASAPAEVKAKYASYSRAGSVITSPFSYAVYKIDVNLDGLVDIHNNSLAVDPGTLREIVPEGMEILNFETGGHTHYGIQLFRAYDKYPGGDPGKGYIDWSGISDSNKYYAETSGNAVVWYELSPQGTDDNIYGARALALSSPIAALNNPYSYGITSSFAEATSGNGGILEFEFGEANQTGPPYAYNNAAYRLYVVMVPKSIENTSKEFTNSVELTYAEAEPAWDFVTTLWTNSAGAAALKKYVKLGDGSFVTNAYNVAFPENGDLKQAYKLELPTSSTSVFGANTVKFQDEADGRYFKEIVDNVVVTATAGASATTPLMTVKPLLTNGEAELTGFSAYNHAVIPSGNYVHSFDYTFRYENVPYGVAIKNTALRTVYTVVPLRLEFAKQDADDETAELTAWEFRAYYAALSGQADTDKPVKDALSGADIVFTPDRLSAYIIPDGYKPNAADGADIVLVETTPPTGYPLGYAGKEYQLRLNVNAVGSMSVTPVTVTTTSSNDYAAAFDESTGIASVTVYNKIPDTAAILIRKAVSGAAAYQAFGFTLTELNGAELDSGVKIDGAVQTVSTVGVIQQGTPQTVSFVLPRLEDGEYYYRITENSGSAAGWSYSSLSYVVQVTIIDGEAAVIYPASFSADLPPLFTNSYSGGGDDGGNGTTEPPDDRTPDTTTPETPDEDTPDTATPETPDDGTPDTTTPETPDEGTPDTATPESPDEGTLATTTPLTPQYTPGGNDPQVPPVPIVVGNFLEPDDDGDFIELGEDGTPLGEWHWDEPLREWVFEEYLPPLGDLPHTGAAATAPGGVFLLLAAGCGLIASRLRRQEWHDKA